MAADVITPDITARMITELRLDLEAARNIFVGLGGQRPSALAVQRALDDLFTDDDELRQDIAEVELEDQGEEEEDGIASYTKPAEYLLTAWMMAVQAGEVNVGRRIVALGDELWGRRWWRGQMREFLLIIRA